MNQANLKKLAENGEYNHVSSYSVGLGCVGARAAQRATGLMGCRLFFSSRFLYSCSRAALLVAQVILCSHALSVGLAHVQFYCKS